jgi:hypothetical protein
MRGMNKTTLTRQQVHHLTTALAIARNLSVPAKFRYAIKKNLDALTPEVEATREAFPPLAEGATTEEFEAQGKQLEAHMKETVEVSLYKTELPDIDDTVNFPDDAAKRAVQNQAIVEALMPIIAE